jgi:hypothetical protein
LLEDNKASACSAHATEDDINLSAKRCKHKEKVKISPASHLKVP